MTKTNCSSPSLANCLDCIKTHDSNLKNNVKRESKHLSLLINENNTRIKVAIGVSIFVISCFLAIVLLKKY
jgi:hypothetical protein